jgi:cytoskeleton protein RodZ
MTAQDATTSAGGESADAVAAPQSPSAGAQLRAAREARGLSVASAADSLRLKAEQIEALERDEHGFFPAAIFVTGYIRAYARLLDLDPEPLLSGTRVPEAAPVQPVRASAGYSGGVRLRQGVQPSMALLVIVLVAAFVLAAVVFWQRGGDEAPPPAAAWKEEATAAIDAPGMPEEAPGDFDAAALADTRARIEAEEAAALGVVPPAPAAEEAGAAAEDVLVLRFGGRSWVEVSDAGGRRLVVRMGEAGDVLTLQGRAPFDVVLGNAPNVSLEYNGSPYTNLPVSRQTVANFRLGGNNEE